MRCRCSQQRTTWLGVPSFISACGVSCRVRAERVKPYASWLRQASDSPRGPYAWSVWVPRPPAPSGGSAAWHFCCHCTVYAPSACLSMSPTTNLFIRVRYKPCNCAVIGCCALQRFATSSWVSDLLNTRRWFLCTPSVSNGPSSAHQWPNMGLPSLINRRTGGSCQSCKYSG